MCSMAVGSLLMMRLLVWSMARLGCHPACVSGLGILRFGVSQTASDLGGGLTLGGGPHALYGRICPCRCAFLCLEWLVWSMARLGCLSACVSGLGDLRFGVSQTASDLGGGLTLGWGPHALHGQTCHCRCAFLCLEWLVWSMARVGCHPACAYASLSDRIVAPRGRTPPTSSCKTPGPKRP